MNRSLLEVILNEPFSVNALDSLKRSICNNIKMLLESRKCLTTVSEDYPNVRSSVYGYGLSNQYLNRSDYQGNRLCREIETLLVCYEPRLSEVVVEVEKLNDQCNVLCFRIEATLTLGAASNAGHQVVFDSTLNLTDTQLDIREYSID